MARFVLIILNSGKLFFVEGLKLFYLAASLGLSFVMYHSVLFVYPLHIILSLFLKRLNSLLMLYKTLHPTLAEELNLFLRVVTHRQGHIQCRLYRIRVNN